MSLTDRDNGDHGPGRVLVEGQRREPGVEGRVGQLAAGDDVAHQDDGGVGSEERDRIQDQFPESQGLVRSKQLPSPYSDWPFVLVLLTIEILIIDVHLQ